MTSVMRSGSGWSRCCRGIRGWGTRWNDHRLVIDGIFFRTRTGCPWRDLPGCFGNWKTVYNRHRRWSGDGIMGAGPDIARELVV
jgi:transposase